MGTGQIFMENTKYENMEDSDQEKGKKQPPLEEPFSEDGAIVLKKPSETGKCDTELVSLITERKSIRRYDDEGITLDELSYFLWCTQGIKSVLKNKATYRTVPSAGARHAFETYLLINNVRGVSTGVYRYIASKHMLVPHDLSEDIPPRLLYACLDQSMITTSAVSFFWAADIKRMAYRYGERGYRYIHLDAGHVCQNLYLAAQNRGCGVCAIAAFDDDDVNAALGLDGENDFVVYIASLGKKKGQ
jgi:SagB-type dehydrogenase family enzyme